MGNPSILREPEPLVRHCLLCKSCEELRYRHGNLYVICDFMKVYDYPNEGCARFWFDPDSLGDEGLATEGASSP